MNISVQIAAASTTRLMFFKPCQPSLAAYAALECLDLLASSQRIVDWREASWQWDNAIDRKADDTSTFWTDIHGTYCVILVHVIICIHVLMIKDIVQTGLQRQVWKSFSRHIAFNIATVPSTISEKACKLGHCCNSGWYSATYVALTSHCAISQRNYMVTWKAYLA